MAKKRNLTVYPATVQPQVPVAAAPKKNHFAIILDESGSMSPLRNSAYKATEAIIQAVQSGASTFGQTATVSLYTFNNYVHTHFNMRTVEKVPSVFSYNPSGGTALFDAVGQAIDDFTKSLDANDPNASFVVIAVTDGGENCSHSYDARKIINRMQEVQKTDRYTITFQTPVGMGREFARIFGIPTGNIREWEQTERGVEEVRTTTLAATNSYFTSRSTGLKSVDSFYVQTDLSTLKKSDLKKLVDMQAQFKSWTVDKESDVKTFVESHGKQYKLGSVYYALTKKEKVQSQKKVLIQEKGNKSIYGGQEARDLIGLPKGSNATVEPGNHANYDIYVQSTSINRKLVRGTKVLFDTTLAFDLTPTWDHEAAKKAADAKKAKGVTF